MGYSLMDKVKRFVCKTIGHKPFETWFLMDLRIIHAKDVRRFIMIYQFEYEEIKRCRECPCHSWADFPDEKDWCDLQDKQLAYDTEPEYNDCPLAAIFKTETTSVRKITVDVQLRPLLDDLEVDIDDIKEYINKLKENER